MKTAIIGCGVIAPVHAKALALDGRAQLAWAIDTDLDRARALGARRFASDWRAAVEDTSVDLVIIATPHAAHADIAIAALASGKHVLCEKPLATAPGDVARMVAAAKSARGIASGVFQHRFSPLARRLRELVRAGDFGRLERVRVDFRCTRTREYYATGPWRGRWAGEGGGVLINQAIHTIDLAQWLTAAPERVEHATVERRRLGDAIEVEDVGAARVRLVGGATLTLACENDLATDWRTEIAVECADASFALGDGYGLIALNHPSVALAAELHALNRIRNEVVQLPGKDVYGDHHALQVLDAISAARSGRAPAVTFAEAATTIDLVLAIYHAAATGAACDAAVRGAFRRPVIADATPAAQPLKESA